MTAPHPLLRLLPRHDRRVKEGHPWAFSNEIAMTPEARALPPGAPVRLEGDDGVRHGTWLFNPHSLIAARRVDADPAALLDAAWCRARLGAALALRERLYPGNPYYRLVHAEADGLPGLVIDRYGDALALQANTAGMEWLTPALLEALEGMFAPRLIIGRNDASVRKLEGLAEEVKVLRGAPGPVTVEEAGLRFAVDLLSGQKTGWFFDQRENRARVAALAPGATVLDAFCHTGGFGLAAAKAGAAQVTLLDRSAPALEIALDSARANGLAERVAAERGEALEVLERWGREGRRFDIVVADPPAFAKSRRDQPAALRGYGKLARLAAALVAPGGFLFIASCSHHVAPGEFADAVIGGLLRPRRAMKLLVQSGAGPDHPVHPLLPESAYLKALLFQLG
ncbi:class I SAM-dependent rRNA methyltransferase [Siccirubricoccus sp. KC 17139]|uniref:Class I SAM-dependent rRNA methyltransferase n=1 Tax=Siccirubricoccus soli TaxID=2899147 RepID=A0ABT1D8D6_9PROT|nr:class I SAM-dependent rRNA methyltransferase [Siccirubricoccus soli]MCO6418171.1 class I SAM-dependent rRNA methyltransferase [Siccirubricoccus soli]MCP2684306.1 class I SAM-dependent rRNA methyltransferase [Siccirubricoccus soli]